MRRLLTTVVVSVGTVAGGDIAASLGSPEGDIALLVAGDRVLPGAFDYFVLLLLILNKKRMGKRVILARDFEPLSKPA